MQCRHTRLNASCRPFLLPLLWFGRGVQHDVISSHQRPRLRNYCLADERVPRFLGCCFMQVRMPVESNGSTTSSLLLRHRQHTTGPTPISTETSETTPFFQPRHMIFCLRILERRLSQLRVRELLSWQSRRGTCSPDKGS